MRHDISRGAQLRIGNFIAAALSVLGLRADGRLEQARNLVSVELNIGCRSVSREQLGSCGGHP